MTSSMTKKVEKFIKTLEDLNEQWLDLQGNNFRVWLETGNTLDQKKKFVLKEIVQHNVYYKQEDQA